MKRSIFMLVVLWILSGTIEARPLQALEEQFKNPPMDCWPHTRWWWPGNAVTKKEITWELEQMRGVGIRGVEQITMQPYYEKGNIPYMSEEFLEMARHAVMEAKRLGMEISFNFGGPGWIIGGEWVPEDDNSKDLIPTFVDVVGPVKFNDVLPDTLMKTKRSWELYETNLNGSEKLLAVVAAKVVESVIQEPTLTVITDNVKDGKLIWQVPDGRWRIMCFWLAKNGHANAVDHFNKDAMQRYCDDLGNRFKEAFGDEFGKTVDSFFADSFELPNLASGLYWSDNLLSKFEEFKGYDLVPYLPAVWWQVGDISPKIRYDVNEFLHHVGMETFFETFMTWCENNGIKGRVQTYGFATDNLQAAGATHIPEMEITPGEKDSQGWFDNRIGPKKYVSSGAHLYGRDVISLEAYTFLHWERYRATLEELKIATDGFLRAGATKFYNHGFCYSPDRNLAPSRRTGWAVQLNPSNLMWPYYPLLSQYIARCSFLLRQGDFSPDIAVYSPLANQWTLDALNPRKWTREFDWDELGFLLVSNGYDFDLINDDALQNFAKFENGQIRVRNMKYKVLLLPNIKALPLQTLLRIQDYVKSGGVVIACDRVPDSSTGFTNYEVNDAKVQQIISEMFKEPFRRDEVGTVDYGKGKAYFIKNVIDRKIWWDLRSSPLDPFVNTIRSHIAPDFGIDFAQEGLRRNNGLGFIHRKVDDCDVYFVTNTQNTPSSVPITFRTHNKDVFDWDPFTGSVQRYFQFSETRDGIKVPLKLSPWESIVLVFGPDKGVSFVSETNFDEIVSVDKNSVSALAKENGMFYAKVENSGQKFVKKEIDSVPSPFMISGEWKLVLESSDFERVEQNLPVLKSWTDDSLTCHFSGTGRYDIDFTLPDTYLQKDVVLILDTGKVGSIADIKVNDKDAGTCWMTGMQLDVTGLLKNGKNHLTFLVTNTNINKVSTWEKSPPVPQELQKRFGNALTDTVQEYGFSPLPASGLLGPVKIIAMKKVEFKK